MPIFAEVVSQYIARTGNPRLSAVVARMRAPVAVDVRGRPGVGRDSVARALAAAGVRVVPDAVRADVRVVVIAEALKLEDRQLLRASGPAVIVLNKADLSGRVHGGPLASARRTAGDIARAAGRPVVPMIAHLATAAFDAQDVAALRTLAAEPADMTSVDAFVAADHVVPVQVRQRLLERLDRYGVARAVLAVADGATPESVGVTLRALSQTDRVVEAVDGGAAEVGYRRVCRALGELTQLAAESRDDDLAAFLATDRVVIAVMASAVDCIEASGLRVDPADDPGAHLRRAVRWRRYADGPLDALHRRCASDISRGSLRLLRRVR